MHGRAAIAADPSCAGSCLGVTADCTSEEEVRALLAAALAEFGAVDVLINAGVYDAQPNGFGKLEDLMNLQRYVGMFKYDKKDG